MVAQLIPHKSFRAIQPQIILQKYVDTMMEWPFRKSIPGSMLQKQ